MTRTKAWVIAAAATVTVILFVLAAGASFGQFGLGNSGGNRAQASVAGEQSERRASALDNDAGVDYDDEDEEDDDDDDDRRELGDDDREEDHDDDDEHEEEDD